MNLFANLMLNKDVYRVIKNITLQREDGTVQIDHVIVSKYGLFVVETKNMKGWIFGSPEQRMWTQKIYKHSIRFQNPLHQNYKHVKTLQSLLELTDQQVHSLVVFVGDSTFKTEMPGNVTHGLGYIGYVKSKKEPVIPQENVEKIVNKIERDRLPRSLITHIEHVSHVNDIVEEKDKGIFCPKCGSPMVMREAKRGQDKGNKFWGCSKFPRCRGIVNLA